ncbi:MAG: bifunctional diaminohydroxyphosphoribosylaminopyrimidine [Bacteroidota bacterium]|jgi:diaminohydroxyphosphoribosylaminopyrimidine deaminase/5-amino-6-(5-phosphoribosylamino)uracil reductase
MNRYQQYMLRCVELAQKGWGKVAPNPMVGAVLVYKDQIIGEGWHQQFGEAHAEVNCINSVCGRNMDKVADATIYVSLEPCAHYGKTPPCTELIISHKIKKVVIGCMDPFKEVAGKGIQQLRNAGIEVIVGVEEEKCLNLNKRFFTFHQQKRPYIILKWAQTADQKIASLSNERLYISSTVTNKVVHGWRAAEQAILIGTNTAMLDNPSLTVRLVDGNNPVRLVIDKFLKIPITNKLFIDQQKTVVYNCIKEDQAGSIAYVLLNPNKPFLQQILVDCYTRNIQSVLVEGGAFTIQQFIDSNSWDEARIIENTSLSIGNGLAAPVLSDHILGAKQNINEDLIQSFFPTTKNFV